ncbi:type IV toxin-antitoxin system AbiEi family antitoxin domain-containing protein [Paraburkholderia phymatum]|uniref:type IV toxin-antitoxin system AbiEi family antitoxin domain-containing protein n=1 Tax=Paraburkholderia phymatum TaxID=148447 RepID=UPI0031775D7A
MASKTLQRLMDVAPRGQPLDPEMLRDCGISAQQTTYLVNAGWLQRLSKGAYLLTGDTPTRDGILAYLSRRIPGLHVGGRTALDWQGVRHNVSFRERVVLWADRPYVMPDWVGEHMPYTLQTTRLFDANLPAGTGLSPLPNRDPSLVVAEPERALLELASDVGKRRAKGQSLEEAMSIAASLRNLRPKVLDTLLSHCTRVKVVKLVRDLGEASGFAWGKDLQRHVDRLGAGRRWTSSRKDGPRFTLKA